MAVTLGTVTTATLNNGGTSTLFSFASNGSPLYVGVGGWASGNTFSGVTFNSVALTKVASSGVSSGSDFAEWWRLASPASTTANIVITLGAGTAQTGTAGAANSAGQDTVTPEGTGVAAKSTANAASTGNLSIAGAAVGDLILCAIANGTGAAITPSKVGGGTQTEIWDAATLGEQSEASKTADAATAVSGAWTGATSWAIAAIPLKVLAATTVFIFQPDPLWPHRAM